MNKKATEESATTREKNPDLPEITGDRKNDLQAYRKSKGVDFGIKLLEYYVPRNTRLIEYCRASRDRNYITENLNIILHGNNQ